MTMCAAGQTKHETVTQGRSGYGQEVGLSSHSPTSRESSTEHRAASQWTNFRIVLFVGLGWVVPGLCCFWLSARRVRARPPPLTPADGHHRCFWLRHRPRRAPCARRHRASTPVRRAACCADAFLWLSSRAFCVILDLALTTSCPTAAARSSSPLGKRRAAS